MDLNISVTSAPPTAQAPAAQEARHPLGHAFAGAKRAMTDAAIAVLAGDPKRVEKAAAALAELRRVEAEMARVGQTPDLSPGRRGAALDTLERKRHARRAGRDMIRQRLGRAGADAVGDRTEG